MKKEKEGGKKIDRWPSLALLFDVSLSLCVANKGLISQLPALVLAPIPSAKPLIDLGLFEDEVKNGFNNNYEQMDQQPDNC